MCVATIYRWLARSLVFGIVACILVLQATRATTQDQNTDITIPEPVAPLIPAEHTDVSTFLLLGSDADGLRSAARTDVIIVVFVHHETGTAALLSIPRDLYVYIPGWQMQRINTAFPHGNTINPDNGGIELLRETLRYNLGLSVERYVHVDFSGFKELIDSLGGIELSVDCAVEDWRLREPGLDPSLVENWEMYTLPVGVHHLNGDAALWYVRSRRASSDFDRGRRQHDVLRAIWRRAHSLGLFDRLPELWQQFAGTVETNITLPDAMTLLSLALHFSPDSLASYIFRENHEVTAWRSPAGASVLLPVPEAVARLENLALTPPTSNQVSGSSVRVEVVNASGRHDMHKVAADRLAWEGVQASVSEEQVRTQVDTTITDYTGQSKGSYLEVLQQVLRVRSSNVIHDLAASRDFDFRVTLGSSYYACTYGVIPPQSDGD